MEVKVDCETLLWNQDICLTCLPLVESVLLQLHCHGNLQLLNLIQPRVCLSALLLQCRQVISNILILGCIVPKWSGVDITAVLQHLWCCSCAVLWAAEPSCACLQPPLPLSRQSRGSTTCIVFPAQQPAKVGTAGNLCLLAVLLPRPAQQPSSHGVAMGPGGNPAGEGSSVPLRAMGCGVGLCTSVAPTMVSSPSRDRPWHHEIWSNWEQGDRRCMSREQDTPVTQSCPTVLLLSLCLVNLAAFFFSFLFSSLSIC